MSSKATTGCLARLMAVMEEGETYTTRSVALRVFVIREWDPNIAIAARRRAQNCMNALRVKGGMTPRGVRAVSTEREIEVGFRILLMYAFRVGVASKKIKPVSRGRYQLRASNEGRISKEWDTRAA